MLIINALAKQVFNKDTDLVIKSITAATCTTKINCAFNEITEITNEHKIKLQDLLDVFSVLSGTLFCLHGLTSKFMMKTSRCGNNRVNTCFIKLHFM